MYRVKPEVMAPTNQKNPNQNTRFETRKHKPENKDNLDSREGEEQQFKGDDVTHNRKAQKSGKSYRNRKEEKGRQ